MCYSHTSQWAESSQPKLPLPGDAGLHQTQYGVELAKVNCRALQNGDRHTRRMDGHSCSRLELEAVGLRSISFLVPSLVEFSSRDLKMLIVLVSTTSCDKWFHF